MPSAWRRCWPISPRASSPAPARALLAGNGRSETHLLVVATAERGLCGGFNTSIVRLAREKTLALAGRRQDRQDSLHRQEGLRPASPPVRKADRRSDRPARVAPDRLRKRRSDRQEDHRMFEQDEFDVATLFYSKFRSVIQQIPTAQPLIPAEIPTPANRRGRLTNMSRTRTIFWRSCCRATFPCRFSAPCWKTPRRNRARA